MKKLKALSLFANVGIAEAYFNEIGVDVSLANEIDPKRAKFYGELYPETDMICGDVTNEEIRNNIVNEAIGREINFIIATPPCQGMSVAGNRNPFDERNQLIYYAIDIIKRVRPDYVLLENVPRQLKTKIKFDEEIIYIPEYIQRELSDEYNFNEHSLIKAKDYGVPQLRERSIFLLSKKSTGIHWEFPAKEKEVTLEDAIGHLPSLDPLLREGLDFTHQKFPEFSAKKAAGEKISKFHTPPVHSWKQVEWMMHTPSGVSAIFNEIFYPQKEGGVPIKAHHNHYRRLSWDKPGRTIMQNNGVISSLACVHPGRPYNENGEILYSDPRVLTLYELLIVMSLPTDWKIPEWAESTFIRNVIGEGIPPLLVKKIINELIHKID